MKIILIRDPSGNLKNRKSTYRNFTDRKIFPISDFGLSKLIKENPNNPEKKNIFDVLPYISPEPDLYHVVNKAEEFSANQNYSRGSIWKNISRIFHWRKESTNKTNSETAIPTALNYQTHPQAIYTSRLLNYSSLPKSKNEENFERELEELTKSTSALTNYYTRNGVMKSRSVWTIEGRNVVRPQNLERDWSA
ncbi:hypothetical protein Glove_54g162 [Diversispora epigaea]|uniref:Protein kinase domain-containing protein n=1 Tax=Diversispora epigaea TaxID=1348612 RepID=A0A397JCP5_9GLOM|nr:hypothetical protein Glove_54g162 [Diversispora epigaea]